MNDYDAVLFFLNAQQPWTRYQKLFFEQNLLTRRDIDKLFILANYWDQIDTSEREDVLAYLHEQLGASLRQQFGDEYNKSPINLSILPVSSKTGENGEIVKESILNYLSERKFHDVLSARVQRLNSYIDDHAKHIDEQIALVKQDRHSRELMHLSLEREIADYRKQRDQFIINLKKALKPEFEEYLSIVEDLFDQLARKLRSMVQKLGHESISTKDINIKLSNQLSLMQDHLTHEMKVKELKFLEGIKDRIEEQKGIIDAPSSTVLHIEDYFLKWERLSDSDVMETATLASGAIGVTGLLIGAGTIMQTLATPVATQGFFSWAAAGLFSGTTTTVSSFMAFGLPGIVVGAMAIGSAMYLKHKSSRDIIRQLGVLADQLEHSINQQKMATVEYMLKNQNRNLDATCNDVDHEINQTYKLKLDELNRIDAIVDQGAHLKSLCQTIKALRLKVNP